MIKNAQDLISALAGSRLPKTVVESIVKTFSVTDLRSITAESQYESLKTIPGIGDKRAARIVELLTGQFPDPLDLTRRSRKLQTRENSIGFSLYSFDAKLVMGEYEDILCTLGELKQRLWTRANGELVVNQSVLSQGRVLFNKLVHMVDARMKIPFRIKEKEGKVSRMSRSIGSDIFGIDYDAKAPTLEWITVEHGIQELFKVAPLFCGPTAKKGAEVLDNLQKKLERRLGDVGVILIPRTGEEIRYAGFAASASHQKAEKLVMARAESMAKHEEAIWFGLKFQELLGLSINGAQIWKMRANLLRPIRCELQTESGRILTINDIQVVPDIVVNRHLPNARTVGELDEDGNIYQDGSATVEKTMADGTILYTGRDGAEDIGALAQHGQFTGFGLKGKVDDGRSCIETASHLEGKPIPNSLKPLMMGEGCWKFDKTGLAFDQFVSRLNELAQRYPGLNGLYLIREGDDLEDDVKIRRLTRSLIQQWIHLHGADIRSITARSRKQLKRMKTLKGNVALMSESGRAERTELGELFNRAPWLVLNPMVQEHIRSRYVIKQNEACACKLRTSGSYPYIQEDLVAVAQIWVFGADPSRMDLGILAPNEISVSDTLNGRKVLAVRFPANYQTAAVRINKGCKEAFASCSSTAMISFYDDILIRQDGDVDGDEISIILDEVAIAATERMYEEFNPPVIVFAHGGKPAKEIIGNRAHLIETMYDDLWKAKKYDGVGKYANLATLCAHFASRALADGNKDEVRKCLIWMSLASTGAILSIDQVKGNAVSEDLIERLEEISRKIGKKAQNEWHKSFPDASVSAPARPMPFTQQFAKGVTELDCMGESNALCDQIAGLIIRDTGDYQLDAGSCIWNAEEAKRALLTFGYRTTSVRKAKLTGTVLNKLAANWFNDKNPADAETFAAIRAGEPVGQKQILELLWRNACALEFRMSGENLRAKKEEYLRVVKEILYAQACSTKWVGKDGHEFTDAEKKFSVVNSAVSDALALVRPNGVPKETQGSYAIFVLKVFAKELLWALKKNSPDGSKFMFQFSTGDAMNMSTVVSQIEELYSDEVGEADEPEEEEPGFDFDEDCPPDDEEDYFSFC